MKSVTKSAFVHSADPAMRGRGPIVSDRRTSTDAPRGQQVRKVKPRLGIVESEERREAMISRTNLINLMIRRIIIEIVKIRSQFSTAKQHDESFPDAGRGIHTPAEAVAAGGQVRRGHTGRERDRPRSRISPKHRGMERQN